MAISHQMGPVKSKKIQRRKMKKKNTQLRFDSFLIWARNFAFLLLLGILECSIMWFENLVDRIEVDCHWVCSIDGGDGKFWAT